MEWETDKAAGPDGCPLESAPCGIIKGHHNAHYAKASLDIPARLTVQHSSTHCVAVIPFL